MMQVSITTDFPDTLLDLTKWEKSLKTGMDKLTIESQKDFQATTSSWDHDIKFEVVKARRVGSSFISRVFTADPLYVGLNNGMPPHDITAKGPYPLTFQTSYHRKTQPMSIGSGRSRSSGPWVRKAALHHPGTEPGLWDFVIAAKHKDDLEPIAVEAVEAGSK